MPKKFEEDHELVRKAVFVALAILLVVVFGKFVTGAVSYMFEGTPGTGYNITGNCDLEKDSIDCCENACSQWCAVKNKKVFSVGVIEPMEVKCRCTCSF